MQPPFPGSKFLVCFQTRMAPNLAMNWYDPPQLTQWLFHHSSHEGLNLWLGLALGKASNSHCTASFVLACFKFDVLYKT